MPIYGEWRIDLAMNTHKDQGIQKSCPISPVDVNRLIEMIYSISHGSITLLIQDRKVIQIDKNEKVRLV